MEISAEKTKLINNSPDGINGAMEQTDKGDPNHKC